MLRRSFALLTILAATLLGTLPVVPGHDVPQHLAYVRLLATWLRDPAGYPAPYAPPDTSNGYATLYVVLARLAAHTSPETALRLLLVIYAVTLALAGRALVRATWEREETALFAPLAVMNPVLCMGLLAYLFALPPLVACAAAQVQHLRRGRRAWAIPLFAAITAALHVVAAGALVLWSGALFVARRDRRSALGLGLTLLGTAVGQRGGAPATPGLLRQLLENVRVWGLVPGTLGTFRVSFVPLAEKLDQLKEVVVGPFPRAAQLAGALLVLAMLAWRRAAPPRAPERGVRVACLALGIVAATAPAAIQVPDDLSLIDLRLLTTAALLALAAIPPGALAPARAAVAVACFLALWGRQLRGAAGEVQHAVRLVERLGPEDRVLGLTMRDASAFLDERYSVLHYAPVYHTARSGGVTSLFWGRYTPHLPIGYLPEREPRRPPDWAPWEVTDAQLADYTHVLVRWPDPRDEGAGRELEERLLAHERGGTLTRLAADGDCALFAIAR